MRSKYVSSRPRYCMTTPLLAQEGSAPTAAELQAAIDTVQTHANVMWTIVAAALVFFMQAGFAMVETGFTRAKSAGNIMMKNLMDASHGRHRVLGDRIRADVRRSATALSAGPISS